MNPTIMELTASVEQEANNEVQRLMTHPRVGSLTALAYVLIIGTPTRFQCGKRIGSYIGMIPSEDSSAGKQLLGQISKQGNPSCPFVRRKLRTVTAYCVDSYIEYMSSSCIHLKLTCNRSTSWLPHLSGNVN
jgi:transposase